MRVYNAMRASQPLHHQQSPEADSNPLLSKDGTTPETGVKPSSMRMVVVLPAPLGLQCPFTMSDGHRGCITCEGTAPRSCW